jgi:hypothetical protein
MHVDDRWRCLSDGTKRGSFRRFHPGASLVTQRDCNSEWIIHVELLLLCLISSFHLPHTTSTMSAQVDLKKPEPVKEEKPEEKGLTDDA